MKGNLAPLNAIGGSVDANLARFAPLRSSVEGNLERLTPCAPTPSWTGNSGSGWIRITNDQNLGPQMAIHGLLKNAMGAEFLFTEPWRGKKRDKFCAIRAREGCPEAAGGCTCALIR